jgi:hypothetical protein
MHYVDQTWVTVKHTKAKVEKTVRYPFYEWFLWENFEHDIKIGFEEEKGYSKLPFTVTQTFSFSRLRSAFAFKAGHEQKCHRGFTTLTIIAFMGICRLTLSLLTLVSEKAIIVRQAFVLIYGLYSGWIVLLFLEGARRFISSLRLQGHLRTRQPTICWVPEFCFRSKSAWM